MRMPGKVAEHVRQPPGVGVVLRQALDVVIERIEAGRGQHARLAQRAAQAMLPLPGLVNEGRRAGEHPTHRAAQPLRQIEPDAVAWRSHTMGGDAAGDGGIEDARAVHMHGEAVAAGGARHVLDGLQRPTEPPPRLTVCSMATRRERGPWRPPGSRTAASTSAPLKMPCLVASGQVCDAGERRPAAGLGGEDVRHVGGDHFVARPAVHEHARSGCTWCRRAGTPRLPCRAARRPAPAEHWWWGPRPSARRRPRPPPWPCACRARAGRGVARQIDDPVGAIGRHPNCVLCAGPNSPMIVYRVDHRRIRKLKSRYVR